MIVRCDARGLFDLWAAWDEDRSMGRVTARCFVFDDAMDRVVWAMDRIGDCAISDLAVGVTVSVAT